MLSTKREYEVKSKIRQLFNFASLCKYPSYKITTEWLKIYDNLPKSCTIRQQYYFKGIYETHRLFFERDNIIFCHVLKNGEIIQAKTHNRYSEIVSDGLYYRDTYEDYFLSKRDY